MQVQYAEDPSKLTEDEKTRAMVLLQRDQRKVRQQQEKKKKMKGKEDKPSIAKPQESDSKSQVPKAASQTHEKLREPIEPEGGYADDDPRKEWADSLRDAIAEKKRRKREERGFKTKAEMGWAPQLKGTKLEEQQALRERLSSDPNALSAAERERAEVLVARDERKRAKKAQRAEQRAKREAAAKNGIEATDADKSLAKKWGFSAKMAAAAATRLKKGLKRGDWECPKCKNKNFARRDKCLKCEEPVPSDHSRWASFGSKEFEHHDEQFWKEKQKEHLERTGVAADKELEAQQDSDLWHCKKCGIGNALGSSVCFRCGKHRGSKKFGSETLAGKIAAAANGAELSSAVDKRVERDAKKAARLGAKLSKQASEASAQTSSSDEDSSSSDNDTQVDTSKKRKKSTAEHTDSSSGSSSSGDSDSDSDGDQSKAPQKDIGFTGSGRDTSGDWTCPRCSNLNWNNREKCNRCPQLRGEKPPPTADELKKQAAEKKKRKKQAAKQAAKDAAAAASPKKPMLSKGQCVLASKEPKDGGDVESKTYTCGGCGAVVKGACNALCPRRVVACHPICMAGFCKKLIRLQPA